MDITQNPQKTLAPGQIFARYKVLGKLGEGGMGQVYRVYDLKLKRTVALKILTNKKFSSQKQVERFLKEVQITAKLDHPHIVKLYEASYYEDIPFFTMTYIAGKSLWQMIHEESLSFQQTAQIISGLARTLHYAHRQGIVHRDLKPSNIIINDELQVFILDFGIAKSSETDYSLTKTGEIVGTPYYMAPEQAKGIKEQVDAQSDIYSLGAVLYEMLTKEMPFKGEQFKVLFQTASLAPTFPRKINPDIPTDLERICLKCMAKKKQDRYKDALSLGQDIRRFIKGTTVKAKNPFPSSFVYMKNSLVCAVFLVMAYIGIELLQKKSTEEKPLLDLQEMTVSQSDPQNMFVYCKNLMNRGLYNDAVLELEKLQASDTISEEKVYEQLIIANVELKNFSKAVDYYENLDVRNLSKEVSLAMAKANYYLQDFDATQKFLQYLEKSKYQNQFLYYQGAIAYKQKLYREAQTFFSQIPLDHYKELYLYLGICQFFTQNFRNSKENILKAQKLFPEIPEVYEFLGKLYFEQNFLDKAIEAFQKCLELRPESSDYQLLLAKCFFQKKLYSLAQTHAYQSLKLSTNNYDALKMFVDSKLQRAVDLDLPNIIYEYVERSHDIEIPDLFKEELLKAKARYKDDYVKWQSSKNAQGEFGKLFEVIMKGNSTSAYYAAMQGLMTLRNHPSLRESFEKILNSNIPEKYKKRLSFAHRAIVASLKKERRRVAYYLVAEFYDKQKSDIRKILKQKFWLDSLCEIIEDFEESPFVKYLTMKTLLHLLELKLVEDYSAYEDPIVSVISVCVLQQSNLSKSYSKWHVVSNIQPQDEFLQFLMAQNLTLTPKNVSIFEKLLQSKFPRVALAAATNFIKSKNLNNSLRELALQKTFYFMENKSSLLRSYAQYTFWKFYLKSPLNEYRKYLKYFRIGLQDEENALVMLHFSLLMVMPDCEEQMVKLIDKTQQPMIRYLATASLCKQTDGHPRLQEIADDSKEDTTIRLLALAGDLFFAADPLFQQIQDHDEQRKILIKKVLELRFKIQRLQQDPHPSFRVALVFLRSLIGFASLENLENEKYENVIASILLSAVVDPMEENSMMVSQKNSFIATNGIFKRYMKHESAMVRHAATAAYVISSRENDLEKIYQSCKKNSDENIRSGAAHGFHYIVRKSVLKKVAFFNKVRSYVKRIVAYRKRLEKAGKKSKQSYIKWLSWAIDLDNTNSRYYFDRAILLRLNKKYQLAQRDIAQAVQLNESHLHYHIEHAKILLHLDNKLAAEKIGVILNLSFTENRKTLFRLYPMALELLQEKTLEKLLLRILLKSNSIVLLFKIACFYGYHGKTNRALNLLKYYKYLVPLKKQDVLDQQEFTKLQNHPWVQKLP